ncbi:MAG: DNA methyltransferase [Candidatus Zixiibacteriota bacterium]
MKNLLLKTDNLRGLEFLLDEYKLQAKVDLIYIDPPFSTGIDFTFTDQRANTISRSSSGKVAYTDRLYGDDFIEFLRQRLLLLREILSEHGSIYLHIDYKVGHYVKILMDEIFGIKNFRNDISRIKCNPKNFKRIGFGNFKDMILFYTKSSNPIWNEPYEDYTEEDILRLYPKTNAAGRHYTTTPIHAPGETKNGESNKPFKGKLPPKGRHWRTDIETLERLDDTGKIEWSKNGNPRKIIYADEMPGKRRQDIWNFKDPQYPKYPTEKNYDMLDMIVKTSSNTDSIVLDCFAGSGTTLLAAQNNGRKWIGIDNSVQAINIIRERLSKIQSNIFTNPMDFDYIELDTISNKV